MRPSASASSCGRGAVRPPATRARHRALMRRSRSSTFPRSQSRAMCSKPSRSPAQRLRRSQSPLRPRLLLLLLSQPPLRLRAAAPTPAARKAKGSCWSRLRQSLRSRPPLLLSQRTQFAKLRRLLPPKLKHPSHLLRQNQSQRNRRPRQRKKNQLLQRRRHSSRTSRFSPQRVA